MATLNDEPQSRILVDIAGIKMPMLIHQFKLEALTGLDESLCERLAAQTKSVSTELGFSNEERLNYVTIVVEEPRDNSLAEALKALQTVRKFDSIVVRNLDGSMKKVVDKVYTNAKLDKIKYNLNYANFGVAEYHIKFTFDELEYDAA